MTAARLVLAFAGASLLVLAGLFVWFWFSADSGRAAQLGAWTGQLRALAVVVGLVGGIGVFMLTGKGRDTREFLSESRFELRKVVWPTREETYKITGMVLVVVLLISLILSGFDFVISWLMSTVMTPE